MKTHPCWQYAGLTSRGAVLAAQMLPFMEAIFSILSSTALVEAVFDEARFRKYELPKRSAAFRKQYLQKDKPND